MLERLFRGSHGRCCVDRRAGTRTTARRATIALLLATTSALAAGTALAAPPPAAPLAVDATATTSVSVAVADPAGRGGVPLTRVSHDPYRNSNAYHRTEVEPDTYAWGDTIVSVFQTGRYPNGGSTNTGFATTVNGGRRWIDGFMPGTTVDASPAGPYARISDPSVSYDAKHDVWLANSLALGAKNSIIVNRSTDGGRNWDEPVVISTPPDGSNYDKNWIACDNWAESPHYGTCYSEVDDFMQGNLVLMFTSTDGGRHWEQAVVADAHGLGGQPLAQPDGTVVVPFSANFTAIQSLVSKDGGKTFTGPYTVSSTSDHIVPFMRTEPLPSAEVDESGTVYVVWQDCRFRGGCATNDIVMSTSENGKDWTRVVRVPIDPVDSSVDHFIPGIGVDTSTGGSSAELALTYYYFATDDCALETCRLRAGFISSTDSGAHWSKRKKVLGPSGVRKFPDADGRFVGDYLSTSIVDGRAFPVLANTGGDNVCSSTIHLCHVQMVAPSDGLAIRGGTVSVGQEAPVALRSDHAARETPRAY